MLLGVKERAERITSAGRERTRASPSSCST